MSFSPSRLLAAHLLSAAFIVSGCNKSTPQNGTDGGASPTTPVSTITLQSTITNSSLTSAVDVVRDEWGIPHIYGSALPDVAFAQGYVQAMDRFILMDLGRRQAEGTLAEIVGTILPASLTVDLQMRTHHLRSTAQATWTQLKASTDPSDILLASTVTNYVAGINAYILDLQNEVYALPADFAAFYSPQTAQPFDEVDVFALGILQAFDLSFDADSEIARTALDAAATALFANANDPGLKARAGINQDLQLLSPFDPTYSISGWTGMNGDTTTASLSPLDNADGNLLALLAADRPSLRGIGHDHLLFPARGSNNWIIGSTLSSTGNTMVANDTHLSLSNPPTFYLNHLVVASATSPVNVMGVQFAGIPGVILGMNQHIAWGATVNNIDVTDVYQETVTNCAGTTNPCVQFKGNKVPLVPRMETFNVGSFGKIKSTMTMTYYDVPQHGPIIPRITNAGTFEPLAASELSIRYTGYEPAQLLRAVLGLNTAKSMQEARASLDRDFAYGGENWVIADDQGHIGWTQTIRVPRRAPGNAPWKVLPGDGSAEWGTDMDPKYIPHAYDPTQGFIATANNDPIGVTDKNDPFFSQPMVADGNGVMSPLYLGADYDPGTRVGRITKRIQAATMGGKKLAIDDLQSIQADATTEYGPRFAPLAAAAAQALIEEQAKAGTHPDLTALLASSNSKDLANLPLAKTILTGWSYDTPSGAAEDSPNAAEILDSQATLIHAAWLSYFAEDALGDELNALGVGWSDDQQKKLLDKMISSPMSLKTGVSMTTGDALLFDNVTTPNLVETKQAIAAQALLEALAYLRGLLGADPTTWRWAQVHTLTLVFPAGIDALNIPPPTDPNYPNGFPRHGDDGTVDVGAHGLSTTDFTYSEGPAIRFVCELTPTGPKGRNALPGGEIFDPHSPHYRDQMELWRKNQTFNLAFQDADVLASAQKECTTNSLCRLRFAPAAP